MKRKIVVTGANGYLGKIIVDYFSAKNFECISLVRNPIKENEYKFVLGEKFEFEQVFEGAEWLIHAAYDFSANKFWKKSYFINVLSSVELFKLASKHNTKLILISSVSSFEHCKSNYGKSKFLLEEFLISLHGNNFIIRPGLIFGEQMGGIAKSLSFVAKFPLLPLVGANSKAFLIHYNDLLLLIENIMLNKYSFFTNSPIIAINRDTYSFYNLLSKFGRSFLVPLPWYLVWLPLRLMELLGCSFRMGSDNLLSIVNQNPKLNFNDKSDFRTPFIGIEKK